MILVTQVVKESFWVVAKACYLFGARAFKIVTRASATAMMAYAGRNTFQERSSVITGLI